jgi:hypothetical protein
VDWYFKLPGTNEQPLKLTCGVWGNVASLSQAGRRLLREKGKGRPFVLARRDGSEVRIVVKQTWEGVPKVAVDGVDVPLARPLSGFEYVIGGLPLVLLGLGGAIGGMVAYLGVTYNYRLLRSVDSVAGRVLGVMGITVASFVTWFVLAALLRALVR